MFKTKNQNLALKFIIDVIFHKIYGGFYYISNQDFSKFINKIISELQYDQNLDISCLLQILMLAEKNYRFKLTNKTIIFLHKKLENLNIEGDANSTYLNQVEELKHFLLDKSG